MNRDDLHERVARAIHAAEWARTPYEKDAPSGVTYNAADAAIQVVVEACAAKCDDAAAQYPEDVFPPINVSEMPDGVPDRIGAQMGRHLSRTLAKHILTLTPERKTSGEGK